VEEAGLGGHRFTKRLASPQDGRFVGWGCGGCITVGLEGGKTTGGGGGSRFRRQHF
jgi:hypothetical protein